MRGVNITIAVLVASAFFGYLFAFIAGFCRLAKSAIIRSLTTVYVEIFRGTSLIVQLFWLYYALPILFNIHLGNDFWVGALTIGLNYGAYMSEIVRSSILSVAQGQREAATALNMSRLQQMRFVIFPQAFRMMLPEFGNYLIQMLKATSLVSLIALKDVLYYGEIMRSSNIAMGPVIYLLILLFYFILALPIIYFIRKAEAYAKKGVASS
ncbi:MAG TPA: amino acid ABC transporter permease [Bacillota bacterium]|nr:amino acid ABC transporter permease [Bacillota bacterium]